MSELIDKKIDNVIEILQAFKEGKPIERRKILCIQGHNMSYGEWEEWADVCLMNIGSMFTDSTYEYRVKRTPMDNQDNINIAQPCNKVDNNEKNFWKDHKTRGDYISYLRNGYNGNPEELFEMLADGAYEINRLKDEIVEILHAFASNIKRETYQ